MSNRNYVRRLMTTMNYLDGLYVKGANLEGSQGNLMVLLYALDDGEPHSQKSICEEWMIPRTTLNTIVKKCEKEGLLTLNHIQGTRREMEICLTEKGKECSSEVLRNVYKAEEEAIKETLKQYSPDFVFGFELFAHKLEEAFKKQNR